MRDIVSREKRYVEVESVTDPDGRVRPTAVVWDDGIRYEVDRVLDVRQACSLKTGGTGMRYTIRVGGRSTYLWFEGPRWFVEAKVAEMP
ncbi:MAG: hypothetical protein PHR15_04440 [Atopobiaceae bacterium]|jgi:hypothetical protein|nr:hypothetical protein [Atopobiaceae bacterium]MCH4180143.1 hypothetical protein [Atopobiaceae bacterium]MCH4213805.1 hypothetical protein [Atopobiaceae bacterium]MCH4229800.1 hypothetical protein [Atopobiaceae bacterium]MCH4275732.1 hypothetical protein [Atopobiaceae bacterium]